MNTIENIKKVSLSFFIITGFLHLGSSILIANELYLKQSSIINKVMDVPFIITGLIYAMCALRLNFTNPDQKHKILDIFLISVIIIVLVGLLLLNFLFPNLA